MNMDFDGAKLALFFGDRLVTMLRDDKPDIPYPAMWDLPGGGREGRESPQDCACRECQEEVGVAVPPEALSEGISYVADAGTQWFFVARLPVESARDIVLGDEGQRWALVRPRAFLAQINAIPHLQQRLRQVTDL